MVSEMNTALKQKSSYYAIIGATLASVFSILVTWPTIDRLIANGNIIDIKNTMLMHIVIAFCTFVTLILFIEVTRRSVRNE